MSMSRRDRKAELIRAGISMADIARQLGYTPQHISEVVAGRRRAADVEQAVAKAIGKPVSKVFPPVEAVA